tara:strand:- start:2382 stop:3047 length:666 start_codon:yes stop_codon:yes gene_type:complete
MALNLGQQITTPTPPNIGSPGASYDERFQSQSFGALNTYFSKLTALFAALFGPRGGKWINNPYGAFQDGTDQVAANTTTAYAVTFDTTDFSNGVTLSNSSRLNVSQAGIYNIQFSIQLTNSTNAPQDVDVWFRKNGTNIDKSNSRFGFAARKSLGDPFHIIAALNFFVSLAANDYVEIMWRPTDVGVQIEHYAASSSPTRPVVPSVIATMTFVSNLSIETA